MTPRAPLTALSMVIMALAGCADSGPSQSMDAVAEPAAVTEGTGGIEGLVLDDVALPIAGATVGIPTLGLETRSDAGGKFSFSAVEPGTHALFVQRLGYEAGSTRVDVIVGQVAEVAIAIAPVRVATAWHETDVYSGHLDWGVRVVPVVGGYADGDIVHVFESSDLAANMDEMYIEMEWTGTQPLAGGMRLRVEVEGEANSLQWTFCVLEGKSPLTCHATDSVRDIVEDGHGNCEEDEECSIQWRGFTGTGNTGQSSADFGVMIDQDFTVYTTMFYRSQMPAGFAARPDA